MNRKRYFLTVFMLIAAFIGGVIATGMLNARSVEAQGATQIRELAPKKWEYTVISATFRNEVINQANSLGEQGWELTSVIFVDENVPSHRYVAYLKRPKQ